MCVTTIALYHVLSESLVSAESGHSFGSLGGRQEAPVNKIWAILTGLGSFAFAYEFSIVLIEIQVSEFQQNKAHGQSGVACAVGLP